MADQDQSVVSGQQADVSKLSVEFKGNGFEYFQIWIVNIVLTIVTLGIYSAWATVRNKRYLYSNTYVDGTSFSFLAEPMTILKARLMAVGIFILISVVGGFFKLQVFRAVVHGFFQTFSLFSHLFLSTRFVIGLFLQHFALTQSFVFVVNTVYDVFDTFAYAFRHDAMGSIIGPLHAPPALHFIHGCLHAAGDVVSVKNNQAIQITRGPAGCLYKRTFGAQEALFIGIQHGY